jgi:hypothetical protein
MLYPVRNLAPGANEVCVDNVTKHPSCSVSPDKCVDPVTLAKGVTAMNIVAHVAAGSGSLDFCIESILPHN